MTVCFRRYTAPLKRCIQRMVARQRDAHDDGAPFNGVFFCCCARPMSSRGARDPARSVEEGRSSTPDSHSGTTTPVSSTAAQGDSPTPTQRKSTRIVTLEVKIVHRSHEIIS